MAGQEHRRPHVAMLPSSGMGHLAPFTRLATLLAKDHGFTVTILVPTSLVSVPESRTLDALFSSGLDIHRLPYSLPPPLSDNIDPFFKQWGLISRSIDELKPILENLNGLSALITDISLAGAMLPLTNQLGIPNYIFFTSSALMLAFVAHFPSLSTDFANHPVDIPGLPPFPPASIPPALKDPNHAFTTLFQANSNALPKATGIILNTFRAFETDALSALAMQAHVPPIFPIGPLPPDPLGPSAPMDWLDGQPNGSVIYVSFGSRTTISKNQVDELGAGLEASGVRFLAVVKSKVVDEGAQGLSVVKGRGIVVDGWVDQGSVLGHQSVGGFVSHCGWNSVAEAALNGVPILAWPQFGDQMINAGVVEKSGLGVWPQGWCGERVVNREDVCKQIKGFMGDVCAREGAARVREEARKAVADGGDSHLGLVRAMEKWSHH
ncbi:UDP-glucose:2-hydroxyflavanone C-glucosyltransferase [Amborella trichopoda]|uniref:Glycosyltransferase n=1 Tax=Amborella trichopoda TaxID=13333 RepID=W1PRF4_AMBTC|nr:UDP-glucose:2-hydroxyflavanone C-glucosyltransferase [Amborella trichopoda]ERN10286.1 hypothetical protein AMTR_s00177p00028690 [Amborella trichopoda]|eukprot:XP_006848705.1 UDP-glucose:2-hydroxyflavanone C-glucosyltransferase [Amborella trichopoda]